MCLSVLLLNQSPVCPLCSHSETEPWFQNTHHLYFSCPRCDLVFMDPGQRLTPTAEQARYELHRNDPADTGYRQFLDQLFQPVLKRLRPEATGLDFGSGPRPVLAQMFRDAGHTVQLYDIYYASDPAPLDGHYDFITACEVVEHLYYPGRELDSLWQLLKPGGLLGIMTGIRDDRVDFARWHYISDPTHVVFFSPTSFTWLQKHWQAQLEIVRPNVVLFRKSA